MEQKFEYNKLPIRTITDGEDQTWFAAIDVCKALDYSNTHDIINKSLDEDERKLEYLTDIPGQRRKTWIISESGLYSLALSSTKPEAKAFKRWITHEVLPTLRKAGKYTTDQEKQHDVQLRFLASEIQSLKNKKDDHQKAVNDLKKDIENKTGEMIAIIQMDKSQLILPFPE